jgi:hypothetical protein
MSFPESRNPQLTGVAIVGSEGYFPWARSAKIQTMLFYADLTSLRIHPRYQGLSREDIDCKTLVLVARKG